MVVKHHTRDERIKAFANQAEGGPAEEPEATTGMPVRNAIKGEPAWKTRNREKKGPGVQFRLSDSQLQLLRMAKADQEKSIQKILEAIVWPVLEEQYGITTKDSPS